MIPAFGELNILDKVLKGSGEKASTDRKKGPPDVNTDGCTSPVIPDLLVTAQAPLPPADSPLEKFMLDHQVVVEKLGRCLDKEHRRGNVKNYKHVAEHFSVPAEVYQQFADNSTNSPTEALFEYVRSKKSNTSIADIKAGLQSIKREDVIENVFVNYEQTHGRLDYDAKVESLFATKTDMIGDISDMLDKQEKGVKNWKDLAAKLEIPRDHFLSFENGNRENPTNELFRCIIALSPKSTIHELYTHLDAIDRSDVVKKIKNGGNVTECSLVKDLMGDTVMNDVCDLLNQPPPTRKGWQYLGTEFCIKKETLDDLAPKQDEIAYPTKALIRHLGAWKPKLTLADFILAVHVINRKDAIEILEDNLPDGCVSSVLSSCDCERCCKH